MASHLKKYVTALASAKDYLAQWSTEHLYADETLIVPFPTLAIFEPDKNVWSIHIKAWVYLPLEGKKIKSYFSSSLPSVLMRKTAQQKVTTAAAIEEKSTDDDDIYEEVSINGDIYEDALCEFNEPNENPGRLGFFFAGNSLQVVAKSIINGIEHLLQPPDESGFIEQQLELSDHEIKSFGSKIHPESDDRKFEYEIQIDGSKTDRNHKLFKCTIYVLASSGVSIISDIDDTIKVSKVLSTRALLKHTFYSYFKPVDGMSELYQKWSKQKCQFHYVSASPWQLYPALRCFLEKYQYPMGTMNLRKFKWSLKYLKPPDTYKIETIAQIMISYPERKYIYVGDSGELDPEIYSELFTIFPQNIAHIFIRDICSLPECLPTCQERYTKAFKHVPKERWTVFKDPKDVQTNIEKLITI